MIPRDDRREEALALLAARRLTVAAATGRQPSLP
jgi:hypothetical protein